MTTLAPVLDLVGDIGSFSLFNYGGARWVAYLRQSGELELHRSGDGVTEFIGIDVPYPKAQVSVAILDNILCIAWTQRTTQDIYFSHWHMGLREYTQQPTLLWAGSSPALAVVDTTKLVMSYRDTSARHVYRLSLDGGNTWDVSATLVDDVTPVAQVDVNVYPASSTQVYWTETADP